MSHVLSGKSILVTGGTGSFGKAFVKFLVANVPDLKRVVIYSRDELKQFEMQQSMNSAEHRCLRYFIGDVRDRDRLIRACEGIDVIVHAAALKQVPTAEYNPMECIKTNLFGAENVIEAALYHEVKTVVALSTDKAAAPINLYGATKLCSDKLFTAANNMKGARDTRFSVVRYGNVLGSRGSVIPYFLKCRKEGRELTITHEAMTRFSITLSEGIEMVLKAISTSWGGEIFVPKIPSYKITSVVEAIHPGCVPQIIGIRPGEKLHEEMITETDSMSTVDCGSYYVILPTTPTWDSELFINRLGCQKVPFGFRYNSGDNSDWLSVRELRALIKKHVDPSFEIM